MLRQSAFTLFKESFACTLLSAAIFRIVMACDDVVQCISSKLDHMQYNLLVSGPAANFTMI